MINGMVTGPHCRLLQSMIYVVQYIFLYFYFICCRFDFSFYRTVTVGAALYRRFLGVLLLPTCYPVQHAGRAGYREERCTSFLLSLSTCYLNGYTLGTSSSFLSLSTPPSIFYILSSISSMVLLAALLPRVPYIAVDDAGDRTFDGTVVHRTPS